MLRLLLWPQDDSGLPTGPFTLTQTLVFDIVLLEHGLVEYTVSFFSLPTFRGLCTCSWIGTRLGLVNTVKMLFYLNSFLFVTKKPKIVKIDVW